MPATVLLKDIVEALEIQIGESSSIFLNEADEPGDEEPDLPGWQEGAFRYFKNTLRRHRWKLMPFFSRFS